MPTTIANSHVENLRQYAEGNMVVRADGDHFEVSSNNSFDRLIVWTQGKLLPASQTRQITEARGRFIAAIGNRYGPEGRAAARDVLGANSTKPLRSRHIRRVFDTLDRKPGSDSLPPAPRESAISRASVPSPGDPPGPRENDLASTAVTEQTAVPDSRDNLLSSMSSPAFSETELASTAVTEQTVVPDSLDNLSSPTLSETDRSPGPKRNMVPAWTGGQPAAARSVKASSPWPGGAWFDSQPADAPPIDTAAMEVQSEPQADPLLEPYQRAGIATEYAQPFLAAGIPPEAAVQGSSSASPSVGTIPRRSSSPASRSNYCKQSTACLRWACARRACSTMRRWIRPSSESTHTTNCGWPRTR